MDEGRGKLDASLPPFSDEFMLRAGRAAVHYLNGLGITAWLDAAASGVIGGSAPLSINDPGFLPVYRELGLHGELTAHVAAYPVVKPDLGIQQVDVVEALRAKYSGVPNLTIPGLKVFADGVVEFPSQTASLTKRYTNCGRSTPLLFTPAKMNALVIEAAGAGSTCTCMRSAIWPSRRPSMPLRLRARPCPAAACRSRLRTPNSSTPRTSRGSGNCTCSPCSVALGGVDPSTNENLKPYIDPAIYRWMYPARSILDTGGEIAGASDWFVSSPNPFLAMYVAETRSGPEGVLDPAQRMPRAAMLYAYTRNAAHALGQLDQIGSIAPGKRADLVLVDRDVLTIPAQELKSAKVVWTLFGGRTVYGPSPQ